jgi:hypothetical protein
MANKDTHYPCRGVPKSRAVPRSEGVVHMVPSLRDRGFSTRGVGSFGFRGRGVE